jgi:hypothetical protein
LTDKAARLRYWVERWSMKKEPQQKTDSEDEEVICGNDLLALVRQRMAERRRGAKEQRPKDLKIEEAEENEDTT